MTVPETKGNSRGLPVPQAPADAPSPSKPSQPTAQTPSTTPLEQQQPQLPNLIGTRIEVDGHTGTIRFHGPVPANTTTDWYGIEWDNPTRGKHSGTYNGITYFTTGIPNSGSFLRTTSKNIRFPIGFLQALHDKYVVQLGVDGNVRLGGGDGKVEVETVGWDKIARKQTRLERLREVGLAGLGVGVHGAGEGNIRRACPSITDLDLSRNLFRCLEDVATITRELPSLQSLRIAYMRFAPISTPQAFTEAFTNLKAITLFETFIPWHDITLLGPYLPLLSELHYGFNNFSTFNIPHTIPSTTFKSLTLLNLEHNALTSWKEIENVALLPNLEHLFLQYNAIPSITPPSTPNAFAKLRSLNLNNNQLMDWTSVHALNSFPSLKDLRLKFNPVLATVPPKDLHYVLVARVGRVTSLNGSVVGGRDRVDAELFYLGLVAGVRGTLSVAEFASEHPRWDELVKLHGEPNVAPTTATSNALKDRLLTLTLSCPSKGKVVEKKLPRSMTVRMLRATVGRVFGVRGGGVRVVVLQKGDGGEERRVEMEDEMREVGFYGIESGDLVLVEGS
ncbi:hypothetical protein HDV00_005377 [Rhizophlyctis rosea]|nr:hypothetical protein HDV00_005377 [Rhizophlyctis rosea]